MNFKHAEKILGQHFYSTAACRHDRAGGEPATGRPAGEIGPGQARHPPCCASLANSPPPSNSTATGHALSAARMAGPAYRGPQGVLAWISPNWGRGTARLVGNLPYKCPRRPFPRLTSIGGRACTSCCRGWGRLAAGPGKQGLWRLSCDAGVFAVTPLFDVPPAASGPTRWMRPWCGCYAYTKDIGHTTRDASRKVCARLRQRSKPCEPLSGVCGHDQIEARDYGGCTRRAGWKSPVSSYRQSPGRP